MPLAPPVWRSFRLSRSATRRSLACIAGIASRNVAPISAAWLHALTQTTFRPLSNSTLNSYTRRKDVQTALDTIYALSTAPGRAAIAIIRISGPACLDIYTGLCPNKPFPIPRQATLRKLYEPRHRVNDTDQRVLDPGALLLYFPSPHTVTGEDVLELHVHGGPAIVRALLDAIPHAALSPSSRIRRRAGEYSHIRPAEPGEFTKRAFYNGRLDLTQAEALGDTLAAETEQQRRLAVTGSGNELGKRYEDWRQMLLYARGELEALIDFSEDQHFDESPRELVASVAVQVLALKRQLELHLKNAQRGELLRHGISVALLGAPNAGKSSLLNLIVGRQAAIVSDEAGTTRDIVDVQVDLGGWLCRFGDMAGLRGKDTEHNEIGTVETEGMRRARVRALESDVVLVLLPAELSEARQTVDLVLNQQVIDLVHECHHAGKQLLFIINKIDICTKDHFVRDQQALVDKVQKVFSFATNSRIATISCHWAEETITSDENDQGNIQSLVLTLTTIFAEMTAAISLDPTPPTGLSPIDESTAYWTPSLSITHRQSTYLRHCLTCLTDFLDQTQHRPPPAADLDHYTAPSPDHGADDEVDIVTAAEHLRHAASCLAKITGRALEGEGAGDVEEVLGVVFERYVESSILLIGHCFGFVVCVFGIHWIIETSIFSFFVKLN